MESLLYQDPSSLPYVSSSGLMNSVGLKKKKILVLQFTLELASGRILKKQISIYSTSQYRQYNIQNALKFFTERIYKVPALFVFGILICL